MKALTAPSASRGATTRRRRTPLLSALAGLAVLIAGTIAAVSPASAATTAPFTIAEAQSGYCYPNNIYVCGTGVFTWTEGTAVYVLTGELQLECNNGPSWARILIEVENTSGTWQAGVWHTDTVCNGTTAGWGGLSWTETTPIKAWEVKVQNAGGGIASGNVITVG